MALFAYVFTLKEKQRIPIGIAIGMKVFGLENDYVDKMSWMAYFTGIARNIEYQQKRWYKFES